ncbi:MAG: aspartyl protease [Gemmatimonadetes bacterium]|nr:aspartyl protease [Gemmatimonadota bacterium]
MGIFRVPVKMKNWQNRFLPPEKQGREVSCDMLVDSGAAELALPAELIAPLKLEELGAMRVVTADGGQHECRVLGMVELEVQGRICQVRAVELPRGTQPLLGAVPLEEMDWHIDLAGQKLVPNPLSPDQPLLHL